MEKQLFIRRPPTVFSSASRCNRVVCLQATYRPFLRRVLEEVFSPDRRECPDMEHMSGGLTDLLKTGFSMFMKVRTLYEVKRYFQVSFCELGFELELFSTTTPLNV